MTPKQADRLRQQIAAIRRGLATEKRKFGGYDDSRRLRYFPTRYYIQLGDFPGGRTYLRWFAKCFPDDAGFADFLFEWTIILFKNGKVEEAAQKAMETHRADIQLLGRFLGRPRTPREPWEAVSLAADAHAPYFHALRKYTNLVDFAEWLAAFTVTEEFCSSSRQFIDLNRQLHGETDPEKRRSLVRQLYPGVR